MDKLSDEERRIGRENYYDAVTSYYDWGPGVDRGTTRRRFLQNAVASAGVASLGLGSSYYGYAKPTSPVRIGVIGTGDEGNVLIGALNPDYVDVVAIADIRPSSIQRAFHGDWSSPDALEVRPGLMTKYGWKSEDEARRHVKVYSQGYEDLLDDKDVEAVIIALPLHLHAAATVKAVNKGKHVLTEKLMGHNVAQCKIMSREAARNGKYLAVGHQRHYSILYDNAVNLIRWGVIGEIHHIRAQWHRGNLPGNDSWAPPIPGGERVWGTDKKIDRIADQLKKFQQALTKETDPVVADLLRKRIAQWTKWDEDKSVEALDYGYIESKLSNGETRSALEELVRWRIWERTGGGLMAELGSHQLDAASIFISALTGKKAHPLTVHAVGGRHIFPPDRDADDHVYCMFEFPGPGYDPKFDVGYKDRVANVPDPQRGVDSYERDKQKKIVVTYSSINGNGFGGYGEVVMGTKGTLILEREKEVMLYQAGPASTRVGVKDDGAGPILNTAASGDGGKAKAAESESVSRGYTEEIEHWAWLIRNGDPKSTDEKNLPHCRPEIALGDAVIALTAKVAIRKANSGEPGFIKFEHDWFVVDSDATPDGSSIEQETEKLKAS